MPCLFLLFLCLASLTPQPLTFAATTQPTGQSPCSPDYVDPVTSQTIRLCPEKTIHIISGDGDVLIGTYDPETSTENTQFFTRGSDCPSGDTYSSELVFTCCAPNHQTKEHHVNSAMQVAPCYFIFEACASRACSDQMLEKLEKAAAAAAVAKREDKKEEEMEVEVAATPSNSNSNSNNNNDRLPPSLLHIDIKDVLNQMLGGSGGGTGGGGGGVVDAVKKAFAGLSGVKPLESGTGANNALLSTLGDATELSDQVQKAIASATSGVATDGTPQPQIKVIQLDQSMIQSLLKGATTDGGAVGGGALAALGGGQEGVANQLMQQLQAALMGGGNVGKGGGNDLQKFLKSTLEASVSNTASREEAARRSKPTPTPTNKANKADLFSGHKTDLLPESSLPIMAEPEILHLRDTVRAMFTHSYDSYIQHAFPWDELLPMKCDGSSSPLTGGGSLTLIDTLDTLVVMGNYSEFVNAVWSITDHVNFNVNLNVSVFETTIRVLGGLLSGHVLSRGLDVSGDGDHVQAGIDAAFEQHHHEHGRGTYNDELLRLAVDVADRMLPAFETVTGIPIGTVNLQSGVPVGETDIASTAGGGSLYMEFGMLSSLTGNATYALKSRKALIALYEKAHEKTGLVGMHINTKNGKWTEKLAGVGSNIDSFYEYLYKAYVLFGDGEVYQMFTHMYDSVMLHLRDGPWYVNSDMESGKPRRRMYNNLQAFWPGLQVLMGEVEPAVETLRAFHLVRQSLDYTPEHFNYQNWKLKQTGSGHNTWPLRPELIESTYTMHEYASQRNKGMASSWLWAGKEMITSINRTKVKCGYATVRDVGTGQLEDHMPSFFLSETLKYLYLLFDTKNPFRSGKHGTGRNYMFTTEAHIFPMHLRGVQHDVSYRVPPNFYTNGSNGRIGSTGRRGTWENHQCVKLPWWKDLYTLPYLSNMNENTQAVTGKSYVNSVVVRKGEGGVHENGRSDVEGEEGTLHFHVKGIGEFDVTPFHGGFSVHNQLDGIFLEVSSLGVNPIVAYMSRPVEATPMLAKGKTRSMSLADFATEREGGQGGKESENSGETWESQGNEGSEGSSAGKEQGTEQGTEQGDTEEHEEYEELQSVTRYVYYDGTVRDCAITLNPTTSLPCSPASFGKYSKIPFGKVQGVLKILKNTTHADQPFVGCTPYTLPSTSPATNAATNAANDAPSDYIVHVARGQCSFEQKVWYAELAGASGIIIGLREEQDVMFVMAGAGNVFAPPLEDAVELLGRRRKSGGVSGEALNTNSEGDHGTTIPVVMVDYSGSQLLLQLDFDVEVVMWDTEVQVVGGGGGGEVSGTTASSLLDVQVEMGNSAGNNHILEGTTDTSTVVPSKIKMIGPTGWGIVLSLHKTVEWQLGIIHEGKELELTATD